MVQFYTAGVAATAATAVTSLFVIVLGEIAPKSYAVTNAERHALRIARPVVVIQRLIWPVTYVFELATRGVNRLTGGTTGFEDYLTREEIETIVLSGEREGVLDLGEGAMIRGVLDLEETIVRQLMVPRSSIVSVPTSATVDEAIEACWKEDVTRIPVYGNSRDDIVGIAKLGDLLRARAEDLDVRDVLTEAIFVPGTKPVDELLTEMQIEGHRMVLVVDEFGTVVGIATLEDAIEEVVGELFDRGEVDPVRIVEANTAIVQGWATLEYVNETLDLNLKAEGPFVTIAGLVNFHTGRMATDGDRVELGDVTFTVLDASRRRIGRVRVDWVGDDGPPPAEAPG